MPERLSVGRKQVSIQKMKTPITAKLEEAVRDICSVSVTAAPKSKVRRIVRQLALDVLEEVESAIVDEINICREEGTPTSRLTSLAVKVRELGKAKDTNQ